MSPAIRSGRGDRRRRVTEGRELRRRIAGKQPEPHHLADADDRDSLPEERGDGCRGKTRRPRLAERLGRKGRDDRRHPDLVEQHFDRIGPSERRRLDDHRRRGPQRRGEERERVAKPTLRRASVRRSRPLRRERRAPGRAIGFAAAARPSRTAWRRRRRRTALTVWRLQPPPCWESRSSSARFGRGSSGCVWANDQNLVLAGSWAVPNWHPRRLSFDRRAGRAARSSGSSRERAAPRSDETPRPTAAIVSVGRGCERNQDWDRCGLCRMTHSGSWRRAKRRTAQVAEPA